MNHRPGQIHEGSLLGGRYRLGQVLGTGGMATVWRAEDEQEGEPVAVKVLSDTLAHDAGYVARFSREAEISERFDHPNLVAVLDHATDAERPFLTMELVEGGTLDDAIERGAQIDPEILGSQLLAGLAHMHEAGIVHRDIKPANVLLDSEGGFKLTDFGIARGTDATRYTQTGQVIGTLKYLAPELMAGEPADERSDLYSVGVVLRECGGTSAGSAMSALIDRLTASDPSERPGSATAALASLQDPTEVIDGGEATAATSAMPAAVVAAGAAGAPASAAGMGAPAGSAQTAERQIILTPRRALVGLAAAAAVVLVAVALMSGDSTPDSADGQGARLGSPLIDTTRLDDTPPPEPTPEPEPQTDPTPSDGEAQPVPCDQIDQRKDELDEQEEAAKEAASSKDEEKAIKDSFKEREEALKDREKVCKEQEKAAEESASEEEEEDD